jgi:hypothetical protein
VNSLTTYTCDSSKCGDVKKVVEDKLTIVFMIIDGNGQQANQATFAVTIQIVLLKTT